MAPGPLCGQSLVEVVGLMMGVTLVSPVGRGEFVGCAHVRARKNSGMTLCGARFDGLFRERLCLIVAA